MRESPELREYAARLFQAAANGGEAALLAALSHEPGVLVIGTDPAEWWSGYDRIAQVLTTAPEDYDTTGGEMADVQVLAYEAGAVGWAACRGRATFPGQVPIPLRVTLVCEREPAEAVEPAGEVAWRVVQWHVSIGVPNEDAFHETVIIQTT